MSDDVSRSLFGTVNYALREIMLVKMAVASGCCMRTLFLVYFMPLC